MQTDSLVTSKTVKHRFGDVSDMTLWRWVKDGKLPQPIKINKRNYWAESTISEAIAKLAAVQ